MTLTLRRAAPRLVALVALCTAVTACAASARGGGRGGVDEFFDESTGANLTVVRTATTFALERSTLAAHARDYVSLVAVEVDRSGQSQLFLLGYFWSTIDRRANDPPQLPAGNAISLFADGRVIELVPAATLPDTLGAGKELLAPVDAHFQEVAYPVSLSLLRFIAGSRVLELSVAPNPVEDDEDADTTTYTLWTDARASLKAFTDAVGPVR